MPCLQLENEIIDHLPVEDRQTEYYDAGFGLSGSFGIRIGSGGRKAFFAVLRVRGKRKRITLGYWPLLDVDSARAQAMHLVEETLSGKDPIAENRRLNRLPSFEEVADSYLSEVAAENCKPSTVREYRRIIRKELLPLWADRSIADIQSQDIVQVLVGCGLERERVALANRVRAVISAIMRYAIDKGYILSNPTRSTERLYEDAQPRELLTLEDLQEVWRQLQTPREQIANIRAAVALRLVFLSVQPISHILHMRWSQLQVDSWTPDGDRNRPIHLHASILISLREFQNTRGAHEFVFADELGRPPRDVRKYCKRLLSATSLSQLTPSLLRYSIEPQLIALGARPEVLAYLYGRTALLAQVTRGGLDANLYQETQKLIGKWLRKLSGITKAPNGGAKVIPLFGE